MTESSAAPVLHGPTPPLLATPAMDHLVHMVLAMAAELTAVTEELDTLRQILALKGIVTREEFGAYAPSGAVAAARAARRGEFVSTLLGGLEADAGALARAASGGAPSSGAPR